MANRVRGTRERVAGVCPTWDFLYFFRVRVPRGRISAHQVHNLNIFANSLIETLTLNFGSSVENLVARPVEDLKLSAILQYV